MLPPGALRLESGRMLAVITALFCDSNNFESLLWWGVGALAFKASRDRKLPRAALAFLITLLIFGVSDLVEAHTGAWWRPWWLFVWKAVCVVVLVALLIGCTIERRRSQNVGATHASPAERI